MTKRLVLMLCAAVLCGVFVAACGSDDEGGGGATAGTEESGATEGSKVIDPASMDAAKGDVIYCTGKDTSGAQVKAVKQFNEEFGSQGLSYDPGTDVYTYSWDTFGGWDGQCRQFRLRLRLEAGNFPYHFVDVKFRQPVDQPT